MSHCLYWKMMIISISKCILPSSAAEIHPGPNWPYSNEWTDRHSNGIVQWMQSDQLQSTEIPLYLILWTTISACMVSDQNSAILFRGQWLSMGHTKSMIPQFSNAHGNSMMYQVHWITTCAQVILCCWQCMDFWCINLSEKSQELWICDSKRDGKVNRQNGKWIMIRNGLNGPITLTGEIISRILSTNM